MKLTFRTLDNLSQATQQDVYTASAGITQSGDNTPTVQNTTGTLRARSKTQYDALGQVFCSEQINVAQQDDSSDANHLIKAGDVLSGTLKTQNWYDGRGHVIKTQAPGGLVSKSSYDGLGNLTASYLSDGGGDVDSDGKQIYAAAATVKDDLVLQKRRGFSMRDVDQKCETCRTLPFENLDIRSNE